MSISTLKGHDGFAWIDGRLWPLQEHRQAEAGCPFNCHMGVRAGRTPDASVSFPVLSQTTWNPELFLSRWNERI